MEKILIIIDMQNDFVTGSLGSKEAQAIVQSIKEKILNYISDGNKFYFTKDTHDKGVYLETLEGNYLPIEHCIRYTDGWDIVPELKKFTKDLASYGINRNEILKNHFGYEWWNEYFTKDSFNYEFELVGVCTDICVITNALLLRTYFPEAKIIVDSNCCAGSTPEKHKAALEVMKSCHIEVV